MGWAYATNGQGANDTTLSGDALDCQMTSALAHPSRLQQVKGLACITAGPVMPASSEPSSQQNGSPLDGHQTRSQHLHVRLADAIAKDESNLNGRQSGTQATDATEKHGSSTSDRSPDQPASDKSDVERGKGNVGTKQTDVEKAGTMQRLRSIKLPPYVAWIPTVLKDWSKMKPVLRSGLAAWICMLFMLIDPVERVLGSASFLVLVGVFIQPAELPLVAVIEREFFTLLLTSMGWAYSNLAIFFAHLARKQRLTVAEADVRLVLSGYYIETAPTAICTAFLAVGVASALYLKVKFGPSPFIFATILTCICLDITLVYAPLYPYPFYRLGQSIVLPLAIKAGIVILISCVFAPKSVNSAFIERLLAVLKPLSDGSQQLHEEMKKSPLDEDFNFALMRDKVTAAEAGLITLHGQARLVMRELSFSLASGEDLKALVTTVRRLLAPADGVAFYFSVIKSDLRGMDFQHHPQASRFTTPMQTRPATPGHTQPATPTQSRPATPTPSRPSTPRLEEAVESHDGAGTTASATADSNLHPPIASRPRHRFPSRLTNGIGSSSPVRHSFELRKRLHDPTHFQRHREQVEVGLWESLRYTAFETQYHGRSNDHITEMCMRIVADAGADLLQQQFTAFTDLSKWLKELNQKRVHRLREYVTFRARKTSGALLSHPDGSPKPMGECIASLQRAIDDFKVKKQRILEPFRASVDPAVEGEKLAHRYLFQCLTYCHFQIVYSIRLIDLLRALEQIEQRRRFWRFWAPKLPTLLHVDTWRTHEEGHEIDHDEDPGEIPGMPSTLGRTRARDPDAMGSNSRLQDLGIAVSKFIHQLHRGNSLFMIKVGITTVLVALPSLLRSSAGWAYDNKAIWVVIMSQFVSARHRGEVLFGLFSRVIATFTGALIGLVIWYIASGNGIANPFALAAVTAVAFPIVMMGRIYFPGPPITPIITCVTVALIVGYSWKDTHNPTPGSPGMGWDVAWRRFLEVVIGALASYIVAILPPSSSMRTYYRHSQATAIRETGGLFCEVIFLAATPGPHDSKQLLEKLLAVRSKIRRLATLKSSISYEWSLRGRWPLERYERLERIELRILRLLTHAVTIYESLGPAYSRALLNRTHFLDPMFLSDCIAVLSMCTTSLSTGHPLPQIAPVLLDRYMSRTWGFKVREVDDDASNSPWANPSDHRHGPHTPDEDDLLSRLPTTITFETLADEQYQTFAVGATVAFGITVHLDRLCVAVKALVGETYAVPADLQAYHPFSSPYPKN